MADTISNSVLGFVFWIVVARAYPATDFGLTVAMIAGVTLVAGFSTLGLGIGLIRYLPKSEDEEKPMVASVFTICSVVSIILAIAFILGIELWSPALSILKSNFLLTIAFILFAVLFVFSPIMDSIFIAKRVANYVLYKNLIYHVSRIGLVVLLAFSIGPLGIFSAWGIGLLLATIVGFLLFIPKVVPRSLSLPKIDTKVIGKMFHFSFANYTAGMAGMLPGVVLPIMILNLSSAEETAYFYIALTIARILYVVPRGVTTSLLAEGSHSRIQFRRDVMRAARLIIPLVLMGIVLIFLFGEFILSLFGVGFAKGALDLLRLLALSAFFITINTMYSTVLMVEKKLTPIILLSVLGTSGVIGIGYLLAEPMGLIGIGIGWLLGKGIVSLTIGVWCASKYLRRSGKVRKQESQIFDSP